MKRLLWIAVIAFSLVSLFCGDSTDAARKPKPWPDVNLSTLPSVVGSANSWAFEINERSPAYLVDLDKMYVSLSYGWGKSQSSLPGRNATGPLFGYDFFSSRLEHKIYDFKFNIYSNLGKSTFGSIWVDYGKRKDRSTDKSIVTSTPSSMRVKTALAWTVAPKLALALSGSISNWPRSLVFVFQQSDDIPEHQRDLPADVGENLVGEFDVLYRPDPNLDIIFGGQFQHIYTKFNPPSDSPFSPDGSVSTQKDTAEVKEYIYSGAPRFLIKRTFTSGDYVRAGGAYYFNLFDYTYLGARELAEPSYTLPSYRPQLFSSFIPKWRVFADGSKVLATDAALYLSGELAVYPNVLDIDDTQWAPLHQSLANLVDLTSGTITAEATTKLTRILHGMVGAELRFFKRGNSGEMLDNRSVYAKLKLGTTTRFYRNLWWSVRIPDLRLYTSEALGSSILFGNRSYIETEILFIGL